MKNCVAGPDLGTSKIQVIIGRPIGRDSVRVLGVGQIQSAGISHGRGTNIDKTSLCICQAIEKAKFMAGLDVFEVYVGISGTHLDSRNSRGMVAISGSLREITPTDSILAVRAASAIMIPQDRRLFYAITREYRVEQGRELF